MGNLQSPVSCGQLLGHAVGPTARPRTRDEKNVARQSASAEITSPPAIVEMARNVCRLTLSFMNWTCPSSISNVDTSRMKAPRPGYGGVSPGVGAVRIRAVRRVEMVIRRHDETAARPFAASVSRPLVRGGAGGNRRARRQEIGRREGQEDF